MDCPEGSKTRDPVAIIVAVDWESGWLLGQGAGPTGLLKKPFPVKHFKVGDAECLVAVSGVGKINAAGAATFLAERFQPRTLVSMGIGGAYPGTGLLPGDVVLASREILADEGVLDGRGRFRPIEEGKLRLVAASAGRKPNHFPVCRTALSRARTLLARDGRAVKVGPFLTVSTATGTDERARQLRADWGGLCENMEGGAVAQIAGRYGIDFFEVRGISNAVGRRNLRLWKKDLAARHAQQVLFFLLENSRTWLKGPGG